MTVVRPVERPRPRRGRGTTVPRGGRPGAVIAAEVMVLVFTGLALYAIRSGSESLEDSGLLRLAWLNNVVFVAQVLVLRKVFGSAFAPICLYAGFLWLFSSGQLLLYAFGTEALPADVVNRTLLTSVSAAATFVVLGFSAFCVGGVAVGLWLARHRGRASSRFSRSEWQDALRLVGWICLAVGIVPFGVDQFHNLSVVLRSGYSAYYDSGARLSSSFLSLNYLVVTGLVFLALSGRPGYAKRAFGAMVVIALLRLVAGDRGEGLVYLAAAVVLWNCTHATRGWRLPTLFGVFAVAVIPAIGTLRHTFASSGLGGAGQAFQAGTALEDTLRTTGATLFPLVRTMDIVPERVPHTDGLSYLASVLGVIPSRLQPGTFTPLTREPIYGTPASWLQEYLHLSYGPGYTPFAEAYLNFGWVGGVLAMAVLGGLVATALRIPDVGAASWPLRAALVIATFALLGFSVRSSFNFVIPFLVWYVLTPAAGVYVIASRARRARR